MNFQSSTTSQSGSVQTNSDVKYFRPETVGPPGKTRMNQKACSSLCRRADQIDKILTRTYGRKVVGARRSGPLDTLMLTILSQNTNDVNRDRAYRSLRKTYSSWVELLKADPRAVERTIRVGGLARIKARRMIDALWYIQKERGSLSLSFLRKLSAEEAENWLAKMKGVGPKTRAIVMLFSLGIPAFPVDTHVHRVTGRMGLIGPRVSREQAQTVLASLVPESEYYNFHINLIEHGRAICVARKPKCQICPVKDLCDYYHDVFLRGHT